MKSKSTLGKIVRYGSLALLIGFGNFFGRYVFGALANLIIGRPSVFLKVLLTPVRETAGAGVAVIAYNLTNEILKSHGDLAVNKINDISEEAKSRSLAAGQMTWIFCKNKIFSRGSEALPVKKAYYEGEPRILSEVDENYQSKNTIRLH